MRLASPWIPRLSDSAARPADRLAQALEEDIHAGRIPAGARLPAHRDLAYRLGIGLGSVTKAYQRLEALGLVASAQGRGMFVRHSDLSLSPPLDLSLNAPPQMLSDQFLAMSLGKLARRLDAASFGAYVPPAGRADHREAKAGWLRDMGIPATGARTLLCNGAQQALAVAVDLMDAAGVQILVEPVTYPGILDLCRRRGITPLPIAADADGLLPEALERCLHALKAEGRRGAIYLMPTIHNPTTSTLPAARREAIVRLCRAYDALILEDDVYAPLADSGPPALANLAPERVFYVGSLSKIVSPGLRMGWLVVPPPFAAASEAILASSTTTAAPLSCFLLVTWLEDRAVDTLMVALKQEAATRRALAEAVFADALPEARIAGFHLWLPRPLAEAERLAAAAQARGLLLLPPRSFALEGTEAAGVRLCLGPPPHAELERALRLFKRLATDASSQRANI
jgi:DNA-binding transcriptional MocR family regulator